MNINIVLNHINYTIKKNNEELNKTKIINNGKNTKEIKDNNNFKIMIII